VWGTKTLRRALVQALVRAVPIEVREVFVEDLSGVVLVVDQHAVGALAADGSDGPFDVAVRLWRPGRDLHYLNTSSASTASNALVY
jgi:hypothetical protein